MLFLSLFCVAAKAHTWRVQRLEMPPRLKYKCTVLRVTRIGSPQINSPAAAQQPVCRFRLRLLAIPICVRLEEISRSCELNPCRDVNAFFMKGF